jgi:hypothetical protein
MIDQSGVRVNGDKIDHDFEFGTGNHVVQVGRRKWARLVVMSPDEVTVRNGAVYYVGL